MAIKTTTALENARLDGIDATFNGGNLVFFKTTAPTNAGDALSSTLILATIVLPADAFDPAASKSKAKKGTWSVASAAGAGCPGDAIGFRICASGDDGTAGTADATSPRIQGTVTATAGGGDITLDNVTINAGQTVTVTSFALSN